MKSTYGYNVSANSDSTGSIIKVDWKCPYCDFDNHELIRTSEQVSEYGFEMDRECEWCNKTATVECHDVKMDLLD